MTKSAIFRPAKSLPFPRPVTKGFYNQWLNEREPSIKTVAIGDNDEREHDWSQWSGPEDEPRFGFVLRRHVPIKVEEI